MSNPKSEIRNPKCLRPVIGLLGGVGAGKSTVAAGFADLGCKVVDADAEVGVLLTEAPVRQAIRETFGDAALAPDGSVDRRRLADAVFADPARREALERLLHPEVIRRCERRIAEARRSDAAAVILDAPLILEKELDTLCDVLVYIAAPEEVRRSRVMAARGWSPSEVARREAFQISLKTKQDRADYTIDNSASPQHTLEQIRTILARLV
jgi:dephospho-CoA kinase